MNKERYKGSVEEYTPLLGHLQGVRCLGLDTLAVVEAIRDHYEHHDHRLLNGQANITGDVALQAVS